MTGISRDHLATELVRIALNPDRLRALLAKVEEEDPMALDSLDKAVRRLDLTRNM